MKERNQCTGTGLYRCAHTQPGQAQAPREASHISPAQDKDLTGVTLLEAVCFPRAGPKASQEEVTSFGKPVATWLAVLSPPISFLLF